MNDTVIPLDRSTIVIDYTGASGEKTRRTVVPLHILPGREHLYLVARDGDGPKKDFRLDRIAAIITEDGEAVDPRRFFLQRDGVDIATIPPDPSRPKRQPAISSPRPAPGNEPRASAEHPLAGQVIVFTGQLEEMSRNTAGELARHLGATVRGDVTQVTTMVVFGEGSGRKLVRGRKLGVPCLDEAQWLALIGDRRSEI